MQIYVLEYKLLQGSNNVKFYKEKLKALNLQDSLNINNYASKLSTMDITKYYYCEKEHRIRNIKDGQINNHIQFYIRLINTWC